ETHWRGAERNSKDKFRNEQISSGDHLATQRNQPGEGVCQRNQSPVHGPDVADSKHQEQQRKPRESETAGISAPWWASWRNGAVPEGVYASLRGGAAVQCSQAHATRHDGH